VAGALAIIIYLNIYKMDIAQWQKGVILIFIVLVLLLVKKLAFENRTDTNRQNTKYN
jgi:uncharacterized membrane protein YjdF